MLLENETCMAAVISSIVKLVLVGRCYARHVRVLLRGRGGSGMMSKSR